MATAAKKTAPAAAKTSAKATAKPADDEAESESRAVATQKGGALATEADASLFAADAGAGMEGAGAESYAIPFLVVLQKMSPQVDENESEYIEGARAGMLLNNVTGQLYSGKDGVLFIQSYFKRQWLRWGARDAGGGFKGEVLPEQVAAMRMDGRLVEVEGSLFFPDADGGVNPKKNDRLSDHRNHYGMLVSEDGDVKPVLLSLTSTQIKKSKLLMSALADVRVQTAAGKVQPASFASKVNITTIPESNDKGSWFGVRTALAGFVNKDQYAAAKAFYESVKKGDVQVKYEDSENHAPTASGGSRGAGRSSADLDDPEGAF